MKIRFVGDVHGKFERYKKRIVDCENSIQVGDLGVGFAKMYGDFLVYSGNPPHDFMLKGNHRFIRGNHDNPNVCKNHSQWIKDGTYDKENDIMFIGGAYSIDKAMRTEGADYWSDEELSIPELNGLISEYAINKPKIMVTHECPESIAHKLFGVRGKLQYHIPSRTRDAFDEMFSIHKPKLWCHGHWHQSRNEVIDGTRFICLAELETIDIDTDAL